MSRLKTRFDKLRAEGRAALVPYITAGDPRPDWTVLLMHRLVASGADIIELGVPFSDPMADGPVIQAAHERALRHGVSLRGVLEMVARFREDDPDTPVVLMGYQNPMEAIGPETFAQTAAQAGVDGVLTVDLPPEEGNEILECMRASGLDPIFLVSPTTRESRIETISRVAGGFVYYVSLKGVTGASTLDIDAVDERLGCIRHHTQLPVGVGFGISGPEAAARVGRIADAVVVGSAIVRRVAEHEEDREAMFDAIGALVSDMRGAIDTARESGQGATS
ncbi:MAG: tryptophan synthase subunit alpha [Halothiobacillaceae bacterium]